MKLILRMTVITFIFVFVVVNYVFIEEIIFMQKFGSSKANADSEKIGTVSLYSSAIKYPTPSRITGHSWIYINNTSDKDFYLNDTLVSVDKGVSLGTTANPAMPHVGVWINVEGYNDTYLDNVSVEKDFYKEDLEYLELYLKSHDKWNILYNCAFFATDIWNNLSADREQRIFAISPIGLKLDLIKEENHEINKNYTIFEDFKPYNAKVDNNLN